MPLVYQQNINPHTRLGVWHITEAESFFISSVPLERAITHPHKRLQHLAGRYLLRELYPDFPYSLIRIASTRKPYLENEAYHFSISHCGDYAAVMVSPVYRVGVDVERISERVHRVQHKFMGPAEVELLTQLADSRNTTYTTLLTLAWSMKETLYKWYGDGELDFTDHLQILALDWNDGQGTARCRILKNNHTELNVHYLLFGAQCLSWVFSESLSG
jgi:phosphopantetheinyl transferase